MSRKVFLALGTVAVVLGWTCGTARGANWTNATSLGSWSVAANWNPQDVPDTLAEEANVTNTLTAGPYTCRVDSVMYSAVTVGVLRVRNNTVSTLPLTHSKVLVNDGVSLTVGSSATPGFVSCNGGLLAFSNATLSVFGSASANGIEIIGRPAWTPWNADFNNTPVLVSGASTGLILRSNSMGASRYGASLRMSGGSLTVTNSTGDSKLMIGLEGETTTNAIDLKPTLSLAGTKLTANHLTLAAGRFVFAGAGASGISVISSNMAFGYGSGSDLKGGTAELQSGDLTIGSDVTAANRANNGDPYAYLDMIVTGAAVTVKGSVNWNSGGNSQHTFSNPSHIDIYSGSLSVWGSVNYGCPFSTSYPDMKYYLRVFGGVLTVSNTIAVGGSNGGAPSFFEMSGGALLVSNMVIGKSGQANGYYSQTGGTNTIMGAITLQTTNAGYACEQFVVSTNATLVLKGQGLAKNGTGAWSTNLLTTVNLNFAGRTVYDPAAGVTVQTNFAFGQDLGPVIEGMTNFAAAGTWDLSALDGSEKLRVVAAGNFATNAVYLNAITGLTAGTAASRLESAVNLYYDPRRSGALGVQDIALTGGGHLKAIDIENVGTMVWME